MNTSLTVHVKGLPVPQGSMKCVGARGNRRHVLIHSNGDRLLAWRERVRRQVMAACGGGVFFDGPVHCEYEFVLPRPQRPRWKYPAVKPDLDKLERAVNDAITGRDPRKFLLREDSRIVSVVKRKRYVNEGEEPGLILVVKPV